MSDFQIASTDLGSPQGQKRSSVSRLTMSLIILLAVITAVASMIFYYAGSAATAALDTKKKSELASLYTVIVSYHIAEGNSPENSAGEKPCIIGELYDDKACLRELARDGYGSPPISPNDYPYLYFSNDRLFYVATKMKKDLPPEQRCPHSKDPQIWCKIYKKT